ncbi:MAG: cyclic nucleotide-binding and patatin-like phospholipase domain-containing protein [bacterium]
MSEIQNISQFENWRYLLRNTLLFSTLSESDLKKIYAKLEFISLPRDSILYKKGEKIECMYFIKNGRVRLTAEEFNTDNYRCLNQSEVLGEFSIFSGYNWPDTCTLDEPSEFLVLYRRDLEMLMEESHSIADHLAMVLFRKISGQIAANDKHFYNPEVITLISTLFIDDVIMFSSLFAHCLISETLAKTLLLINVQEEKIFSKRFGAAALSVEEALVNPEDFKNIGLIEKVIRHMPNGVDIICFPEDFWSDKRLSSLHPLLTILKERYQFQIALINDNSQPFQKIFINEADTLILVSKANFPKTININESLESLASEARREIIKVFLQCPSQKYALGKPDITIPWSDSVSKLAHNFSLENLSKEELRYTRRMVVSLAHRAAHIRLGLALGSGAAFGYSIIGILKVLESENIYPDLIAGTSIGAFMGAAYLVLDSIELMEKIALKINRRWLFSNIDPIFPRMGFIEGIKLKNYLKRVLGDKEFQELHLPFACVATDIMTGEEVVLREGKLHEAIRASLSLPFFFEPYRYNDSYLVDGGLVNPVPTSVLIDMGADILLSVNLTSSTKLKKVPMVMGGIFNLFRKDKPNILEVFMKTIFTMEYKIARFQEEMADITINPNVSNYTWADFNKAQELIEIGVRSAEIKMLELKSKLPRFLPPARSPYRHPLER